MTLAWNLPHTILRCTDTSMAAAEACLGGTCKAPGGHQVVAEHGRKVVLVVVGQLEISIVGPLAQLHSRKTPMSMWQTRKEAPFSEIQH